LLHFQNVRIIREGPEALGERQAYAVLARDALPATPVHAKFWFWPEGSWVLLRWHWPYADRSPKQGTVCELTYGETVHGVPIVKSGRYVHPANGLVVWRANVVSYELTAPRDDAFGLAAFGLPEPEPLRPFSRLWLWALVGIVGIVTALLLMRLAATRQGPAQRENR